MDPEPRTTIAVRPASALAARPRLFAALEAAFPVAFRPWEPDGPEPGAILAFVADPGDCAPDVIGRRRVPTLVVADSAAGDGAQEAVTFAGTAPVDRRLRGVAVADRLLAGAAIVPGAADEVLARAASGVAWTRSPGDAPLHRVRSVLPELEPGDVLVALLWRRTVATVALVHFLRALTRDAAGWQAPPLRAAFVFDDPNLRWRSYGYLNYEHVLAHADAHNYHASMAMIPLDARLPHRATAELFRRRRDRLSLNVHGNDHVKRELLRPRTPESALALAGQAIRRVARFERRSGVPVDRVMMPPHGMCSKEIAHALGAVGFDALCTIHPQPWTSTLPSHPPLAAWQPAGFVFGCPVILRLHLHADPGLIALRAFLDQPIVLYAHHEDMAGGLEPLAEAARLVNGLGDVTWGPVGELALANVGQRLAGHRLIVRPFARRVRVDVPAGAAELVVEAPGEDGAEPALTGWSAAGGAPQAFGAAATVTVPGPQVLRLHGRDDVDPASVAAPGWSPWPLARRVATEARDRALPVRAALAR